eukprot:scaffold182599_cov33-Tisochrysis_lutea.AAC.1
MNKGGQAADNGVQWMADRNAPPGIMKRGRGEIGNGNGNGATGHASRERWRRSQSAFRRLACARATLQHYSYCSWQRSEKAARRLRILDARWENTYFAFSVFGQRPEARGKGQIHIY